MTFSSELPYQQSCLLSDIEALFAQFFAIQSHMKTKYTETQEIRYTTIFEKKLQEWTTINYPSECRKFFTDERWFNILKKMTDSHDKAVNLRYTKAQSKRTYEVSNALLQLRSSLADIANVSGKALQSTPPWVSSSYQARARALLDKLPDVKKQANDIAEHFESEWK